MGHRHFGVLYILQRFVLALKHSHYAFLLMCMKHFRTLRNEKEQKQFKLFEKLPGKLIFLRATKNLKIIYFTHPTVFKK